MFIGNAKGPGRSAEPQLAALHSQGVGAADQLSAFGLQGPGCLPQKGLGEQQLGAGAYCGQLGGTPRRQAGHRANAKALKQGEEALFHAISQRAHQQQLGCWAFRHQRNQGGERLVFPLGEGGFDATAAVVHHLHAAAMLLIEALSGFAQVQLDHFAGARPHQKQGADFGPALQQVSHHPIELLVGIREASEIPFAKDRGAKARFGKDHHAGGALDQVRAGA